MRVSDGFFDQLDQQLGSERGADGRASSTDFLVMELPAVVERFATDFDGLPEIVEGFTGGRMLIASGIFVRAFTAYGVLITDDSIEIIGIEFDPWGTGR